jgi:capsular polysaccharide biosynthesis protein
VAGLLTGGVAAAFGPATVSSTAQVALPLTSLTQANSVAIAESNLIMVNALNSGASLGTLRSDVQVTSPTSGILSVTARAGTAAQAEATANAVAESYLGYAGSAGSPAGHTPAIILRSATSASGGAGLMRLLVGAMLGLVSGAAIGVIAALAKRRLA